MFPPAYTTSKDGKPLLSWRVLILPYLEQEALYKEFHLDEPWDSPHNRTLIARMPAVYRCPMEVDGRRPRGEDTLPRAAGERGPSSAELSRSASRISRTGCRIRSCSSMPATTWR